MSGRGRVLLVEDEFLVASLVEDLLDELGYDVVNVASARAAMEFAATGLREVDIAIVDLGLPDGAGLTLVDDMRALRQDLPVIISTGRDEDETREQFTGVERIAILRKPYGSEELGAAIKSLSIG